MIPNPVHEAVTHRQHVHFVKMVDRRLAAKRWGRSDLARAIGMSRQVISDYMKLKSSPTPRSLNAIADALGVPADTLWPAGGETLPDTAPETDDTVRLTLDMLVPHAVALQVLDLLSSETGEPLARITRSAVSGRPFPS